MDVGGDQMLMKKWSCCKENDSTAEKNNSTAEKCKKPNRQSNKIKFLTIKKILADFGHAWANEQTSCPSTQARQPSKVQWPSHTCSETKKCLYLLRTRGTLMIICFYHRRFVRLKAYTFNVFYICMSYIYI